MIDQRAKDFLSQKDNKLYVLRSTYTGMAINVSYSMKGLKYTVDKRGHSIFYSNGILRDGKIVPKEGMSLIPSNSVFVERFIPIEHESMTLQAAELNTVRKAYKLLYPVYTPYRKFGSEVNN